MDLQGLYIIDGIDEGKGMSFTYDKDGEHIYITLDRKIAEEIVKRVNEYGKLESHYEKVIENIKADFYDHIEKTKQLKELNSELVEALEKISICIKNTPTIGDLDLLKLRTGEIDYLVKKIKEEL